jgi:Recombinase
MLALGIQSKREITRTRIRVRTAMAAQAREQGRYLGGRPPYGYRLADAGPHPNKAHAAWGRRAWRLEPDPDTAPVVQWIFAQRLAGHSLARITRALTEAGIPCPSAADPERNRHRAAQEWSLTTVRAILANPRYTGRQVWNRQPTAMDLIDPANTGLGHRQVQRWGLPDGWVISARPAHPALASEEDFIAAHGIRAAREGGDAGGVTSWPAFCAAGSADGGPSHAGPTAGPPTGAATGTPAPARRSRPAEEPVHPRGPYPGAPGRSVSTPHGHRSGRRAEKAPRRRRMPAGQRRGSDRLPARPADHPHLRPAHRDPAGRRPRSRDHRHRPRKLTPRALCAHETSKTAGKEASRRAERPALAEAWVWVMSRYARNHPGMYKFRVRGPTRPIAPYRAINYSAEVSTSEDGVDGYLSGN